jgi:two-component system, OmpR family, phosphate regulon sensor histidine kinase PhoR
MRNFFSKFIMFLMTASLIGIVFVQLYWLNTSLDNNLEQFRYHIKQVLADVANQLEENEVSEFMQMFQKADSMGFTKTKNDLKEFGFYEKDKETNQTYIYKGTLEATEYEDFVFPNSFFENNKDSVKLRGLSRRSELEVFNNQYSTTENATSPNTKIIREGGNKILDKANFQMFYKEVADSYPIQKRISTEKLHQMLTIKLKEYGVDTPFEFALYSNGISTKVRSENFENDKKSTYNIPVFKDVDGLSKYQLMITFPEKSKFLISKLLSITILSFLFTIIIIIAYWSTWSQMNKQKQISEIKTDFINNMTHEFKTPIATINLALDAIKNPKVIDDKEKVQRYMQMIREENKRMNAQVENVLQISKLEKRELEIEKEPLEIETVIEDAIEHTSLILESKEGEININLQAQDSTVMINEVHFTNVLVNILENAVKYAIQKPIILVSTENINYFLIIKIKDNGPGMSKVIQKRIFEKFYREHTGDIHNVKGHGLGLAYVKRIVEEHNGFVSVESEKGKGSTFIIKLPLIKL